MTQDEFSYLSDLLARIEGDANAAFRVAHELHRDRMLAQSVSANLAEIGLKLIAAKAAIAAARVDRWGK